MKCTLYYAKDPSPLLLPLLLHPISPFQASSLSPLSFLLGASKFRELDLSEVANGRDEARRDEAFANTLEASAVDRDTSEAL